MSFFTTDSPNAKAHSALLNESRTTHHSTGEDKCDVSHQLIGGAAAYAAARAFERHVAVNGKPDTHPRAKEFLDQAASAEVDKLFESNRIEFVDKDKAKAHAQKENEAVLRQTYSYQYGD